MNILVANDDGIRAEGIYKLVEALSQDANIYVCAPHIQRSASGHGISIGLPIEANEVQFDNAKLALEMTGTPADCVKLGLRILATRDINIDMVFAGINHGGNLGTDTLYSGTVSAAVEGCFCKKPSVAVSVNSHHPGHFDFACELALKTFRKSYGRMDNKTVLNINVPNLPKSEVKGVKYTRLGAREYDEWFKPTESESGALQYWYSGKPIFYEGLSNDIDVIAMQEGYATITPLQYDLTNHALLEEVRNWKIEE
jgi:5'-nucleotidase